MNRRLAPAGLLILCGLAFAARAAGTEEPICADPSAGHRQSLDGVWQIANDPYDIGAGQRWSDSGRWPAAEAKPVAVPGRITDAWPNPRPLMIAANHAWYRQTFTAEATGAGRRTFLRFGAVRLESRIWLNGRLVGAHRGGEDPFEFDVTSLLEAGRSNTLIVEVKSPFLGGINQHVTLVTQPNVRIIDGFARPDLASGSIGVDVTFDNRTGSTAEVDVTATFGEFRPRRSLGIQSAHVAVPPGISTRTLTYTVAQRHLWSLEDPFLYTIGLTSQWAGAPSRAAGRDQDSFRTGFRDFRIVNGYYSLNGQRLFVRSTHLNWYDPVVVQGTPGSMQYLDRDIPQLKKAGFNMMRFLTFAALPEQLDEADEQGMLVYSEHETAWPDQLVTNPEDFGLTLNQVVRRDRNHPSLALWGLLNETLSLNMFQRAKAWLPSLRAIDDTRLVQMSSGRWDMQFRTASASNPGSNQWNVYQGGEDPVSPVSTGHFLPREVGAFYSGTGDAHIYTRWPLAWPFLTSFLHLAEHTKPFFVSEAGMGDLFADVFKSARDLHQAGAPPTAYAWQWVKPLMADLQVTWAKYGLTDVYPSIESLFIDSSLSESQQRALIFDVVRGNPKINGYSLTSETETWGEGEGIMDGFRDYKPGLLAALQAGWAPVRWSLFVNPANGYVGAPLHVKAVLANEDRLSPGDHAVTLKITGPAGPVWTQPATVRVAAGPDAPFAYPVYEGDVSLPGVPPGEYRLQAELAGGAEPAAADTHRFFLTSQDTLPAGANRVTLLGVDPNVRSLLAGRGASLHDYAEGESIDREVILIGNAVSDRAAAWRSLYGRIARGAQAVFLSPQVFAAEKTRLRWLALITTTELADNKPGLNTEGDGLYHKEIIAKDSPIFAGLPHRVLRPDYYGDLLAGSAYFDAVPVPDEIAAVTLRGFFDLNRGYHYDDGVVIGTYRFHAGRFTLNGLNLSGNVGNPAADRLLLNLVREAAAGAVPLSPLPAGWGDQMDALGIKDRL